MENSTAYQNWIYQQLEPTDILKGSGRRYQPISSRQAAWNLQDEQRAKMGEDEYLRRVEEFNEAIKFNHNQ